MEYHHQCLLQVKGSLGEVVCLTGVLLAADISDHLGRQLEQEVGGQEKAKEAESS